MQAFDLNESRMVSDTAHRPSRLPLAQAADCSTPKRAGDAILTFLYKHYQTSSSIICRTPGDTPDRFKVYFLSR